MSDAEAATPPPSSGSGPNAIIIAAVVGILMLGGAFGIANYILPGRIADELAKRMATDDGGGAAPAAAPAGDKKTEEAGKEGGKEGKADGAAKDFVLTDLLVNISGTSGTRFVKATVFFDAEPAVLQDLERQRAKITDIVQQTIASKKMDELTSPDSRGKLRSELLSTINPLLDSKGEVRNIYFQEFIIQ